MLLAILIGIVVIAIAQSGAPVVPASSLDSTLLSPGYKPPVTYKDLNGNITTSQVPDFNPDGSGYGLVADSRTGEERMVFLQPGQIKPEYNPDGSQKPVVLYHEEDQKLSMADTALGKVDDNINAVQSALELKEKLSAIGVDSSGIPVETHYESQLGENVTTAPVIGLVNLTPESVQEIKNLTLDDFKLSPEEVARLNALYGVAPVIAPPVVLSPAVVVPTSDDLIPLQTKKKLIDQSGDYIIVNGQKLYT